MFSTGYNFFFSVLVSVPHDPDHSASRCIANNTTVEHKVRFAVRSSLLQALFNHCMLYGTQLFFFFFSFSWALLSSFFNVAKEQHPMVSKATTVQIEHEGQEISLYLSSKHTGYDFCEKRSNRSQEKKPYLYILQSFCGKCLPT